ncbi:MAG: Flp pilus assembly protein CpaB [Hyphomicrobiaceae bacterium]|nr:Flp pilus assembly protein CpaB [Hyphomicrobiaceae bacterium]
MKQARLIVALIGLVAAGGAILLAKSMTSKPQQTTIVQQIDTVEVLVAKIGLKLGDVVKDGDLRWQPWPSGAAGGGYIRRTQNPRAMSEFRGAIARGPILSGEPITAHKLIKGNDGGVMAAILPAGMRAISTTIREETAAGGFILPNDRVDVILIRKLRSRTGGEEHVSDTLFRNVRVLAIGQNIETKEGKKVVDGKTATLELTPRQSELLALARSMGEISLSLRSIADLSKDGKESSAETRLRSQRGNSIRVLRYGVKSRAYGVN